MSLKDLFVDTVHTLWAHKLRTLLTMFGITWGVVSITLMTGAGEGLKVGQEKVAASFGKNLLILFGGRTSMQAGGTRAGRSIRFQADDHARIAPYCPSCEHIMPELGRNLTVQSSHNSATLMVTGAFPAFADIRSIDVAQGRFYSQADCDEGRAVAFLGSDARKQLFGDRNALGQTVSINGKPYKVIGVMLPKEQDSSYDGEDIRKVFIPFPRMLGDFPNPPPALPTHVDRLLVAARSFDDHLACKRELRLSLARIYDCDPNDENALYIWDTIENTKAFNQLSQGMKYFLGAVGIATLLIGGIGVMNVMLVAVRERTREIGLRKAVGATSGSILFQFVVETMFVVAISGGTGLLVAYGLCSFVNSFPMPQFFAGLIPAWEFSVLSLVLLGAIALLSGLYPATRAALIDPIEALRHEAGG
ncbi:MAG: ABC transporter permease [Bryobacterales bacterium]|nr:ABC transporter permease [Bryobacterales bacterium]